MTIDQRKSRRRNFGGAGTIYGPDGKRIVDCQVRDISATGAQIAVAREMPLPREFTLALSQNGQVRRSCVVVWQFSIVVGVSFVDQSRADEVKAS